MRKEHTPETKSKPIQSLELFIVSINYIIISYALSNMALFFNASLLYILFFASEMWAFSNFWSYTNKRIKNKIIAAVLVVVCFLVHIGMVYFIGRVSGSLVPFR